MRVPKYVVVLLLAVLSFPSYAQETFETETVVIQTSQASYRFQVELALTPEQQTQGLMFRQSLRDDRGMLFVFKEPKMTSFWMYNTYLSLDMLFISQDGIIVQIHRRARPGSTEAIPSLTQVKGVLEIKGGMADRLGIKVGDRVFSETLNPTTD